MNGYISVPTALFVVLFVGTFIGILVYNARKKAHAQFMYDQNLAKLPRELQVRLTWCKDADRKWFEEYGDALNGIELDSPLAIAISAGWRAMDCIDELLRSDEFSTYGKSTERFLKRLSEAEFQFATANDEYEKLEKEVTS